jgi:hypothetical protein
MLLAETIRRPVQINAQIVANKSVPPYHAVGAPLIPIGVEFKAEMAV